MSPKGKKASLLEVEVNMKGICLLCFNPNSPDNSFQRQCSITAFKMLLRYLKVDLTNWTNSDNLTLNLGVSLCRRCYSITNEFLEFFQEFERIRLQLDLRICQLQDLMGIRTGRNGGEVDQAGARIAECLRKEMKKKVSLHLKCSPPRLSLTRLQNTELNKNQPNKNPSSTLQFGTELQKMVDSTDGKSDDGTNSTCEEACSENSLGWTPDSEYLDSDEESQDCQENVISENDKIDKNCNFNEPTITGPVTGTSPWKCIICGESFPAKGHLEIHQLSKHVKSFIPPKGLKLLPSSISEQELGAALVEIVSDVKTDEGNVNECPFCRKGGFQGKFQCGTHLLLQHLPKIISRLNSKDLMDKTKNAPVKTVSSDSSKSSSFRSPWRKCEHCDQHLAGKYKLQVHQMSMHPMPFFVEKGLLSSSSGISEKKLMSTIDGIVDKIKTPFQCPLCKNGNSNKYHLRAHFVRHHPHYIIKKLGLPVPVEGDGDVVVNKGRKRTNQTIPFKCKLCGMRFRKPYDLKDHQFRVHMTTVLKGSLPSSATEKEVNDAIQRITSRSKAVSINHNNRPLYECVLCNKRVWNSLKVHLVKCHLEQVRLELENRPSKKQIFVSKIKLFKCVHCGKGFRRKAYILPHSVSCRGRPKQVLDRDFQKISVTGEGQSEALASGNPSKHEDDAESMEVEECHQPSSLDDGNNGEDAVSSSKESVCSFDRDASVKCEIEAD